MQGPCRNIKLTMSRVFVTLDWFREFIQACCAPRLFVGVCAKCSGRALEKRVSELKK